MSLNLAPCSVACLAPAKINLYLHVVGRRPDGYHFLDSLIVFADVGDWLTVFPSDALSLSMEGPFAGAISNGPDNLILRAANALREFTGNAQLNARIALRKTLPVAGGIGGGSADAAAALLALRALWRLAVTNDQLLAIGAKLGADVPACITGQPVLVSGIGDHLTPVDCLPDLWVVLANPGTPVGTADVFARVRQLGRAMPLPAGGFNRTEELGSFLRQCRNDLEQPALAFAPQIGEAINALAGCSGCIVARMSGSGATCFGVFGARDLAERAAAELQMRYPSWWTTWARILGERPRYQTNQLPGASVRGSSPPVDVA